MGSLAAWLSAGRLLGRPNPPPGPLRLGTRYRTFSGAVRAAARAGATSRQVGRALWVVARMLLADMEARGLVDDDRPELALAILGHWCEGEGDEASLREARRLLRAALETAEVAFYAASGPETRARWLYCVALGSLLLAAHILARVERSWPEMTVVNALDDSDMALREREDDGSLYPHKASRARVLACFLAALEAQS